MSEIRKRIEEIKSLPTFDQYNPSTSTDADVFETIDICAIAAIVGETFFGDAEEFIKSVEECSLDGMLAQELHDIVCSAYMHIEKSVVDFAKSNFGDKYADAISEMLWKKYQI